MNKPRKNFVVPEKMRTGFLKSTKCTTGGVTSNKENKFRGALPNKLGGRHVSHTSKNARPPTKALNSHRPITRRLSFSKNDLDSADRLTPCGSKLCNKFYSSSNRFLDNCGDSDASMLIPLNSTSIMGGTPSPYSIDLFGKAQQKKVFPDIETCMPSQYDNFESGDNVKIGLSDETKNMLKEMGIDTSPDCDSVKEKCEEKVPLAKAEENKVINCVDNATQTTPQLDAIVAPGNSSAVRDMLAMLKNIHERQSKEREELNSRHAKEVEDAFSCFAEMIQGDSKEENNLPNKKSSLVESASGVSADDVLEDNIIGPDSRIEASSNYQVPPAGVASAQPIFQTNEKQCPAPAQDKQEPLDGINGNHPVQKSSISTESAPCPDITITKAFQDTKNSTPDKNKMPHEWEKALCPQTWRKQEVSLLDSPFSIRSLVSEEIEDVSMCNTPTIRLNSLFQGMSLQGQQTLMETPATRRLVQERILKGVESLF